MSPTPIGTTLFAGPPKPTAMRCGAVSGGHVRPGLNEIRVEQVSEGSEQALRAFLDRCILEAHERTRQEAADRREDEEALERRRTEASYGYQPTEGGALPLRSA